MKELWKSDVVLYDGELLRRRRDNRDYLMELKTKYLLVNYQIEAVRGSEVNCTYIPEDVHGGWESAYCQLRGHFLGHWLSAAAMYYCTTGDKEILGKAEKIVQELRECQIDNGGQWVAAIPEKYFLRIRQGKTVWAPHYTVHKLFMGLVDMYELAGNELALEIADHFADWFVDYANSFTREEFDNVLDYETGGMLEVWVQLYGLTGKEKYRTLMEKYYRGRLFDRLLEGVDPLTNMHANTTIPEVIGCAAAYDLTGEEKYRKIVENYWDFAVTKRGSYVTGGQTCAEIWTPKMKMDQRLSDLNQEHCTVYNMIRLADFLFRWTGKPEYAQYIEYNLYNGIMAQSYWRERWIQEAKGEHPHSELLTYFLPMKAGSRKNWASRTKSFYCCHGSVVQANAAWNRNIYYQDADTVYVCQYFASKVQLEVGGKKVGLNQYIDYLANSTIHNSVMNDRQKIQAGEFRYEEHPDTILVCIKVMAEEPAQMKLKVRIPEWITEPASVWLNGEMLIEKVEPNTFAEIDRVWNTGDVIKVYLAKGIVQKPLPGSDNLVGFTYGPQALAGYCSEEVALRPDANGQILYHCGEREWGSWKNYFKTRYPNPMIYFEPIENVGYEPYTVYFPVCKE